MHKHMYFIFVSFTFEVLLYEFYFCHRDYLNAELDGF